MKFRIKHADKVVGLFILLAAAFLCAILVMIGLNQRWFAKNYYFESRFPSGSGIAPGTAIQLKGFPIGKIHTAKLNEKNEVDVVFYVFDTYIDKVKVNSILELSVSPIGLGTQLLFHPGKSEILAPEQSFIPASSTPEGVLLIEKGLVEIPVKDDTITRLLYNVNPLLENVNKLVSGLNTTVGDLNLSLKGEDSAGPVGKILDNANIAVAKLPGVMQNITNAIDRLKGSITNINDLITSLKDKSGSALDTVNKSVPGILEKAQDSLASFKESAENIKAMTEAIKDPTGLVPKLLDPKGSLKTILDDDNKLFNRIESLIDSVDTSLQNVKSMTGSLTAELPRISTILQEGKTTLEKAQDVLEGLKNNPILKGGIPERKEQQPSIQGLRDEAF